MFRISDDFTSHPQFLLQPFRFLSLSSTFRLVRRYFSIVDQCITESPINFTGQRSAYSHDRKLRIVLGLKAFIPRLNGADFKPLYLINDCQELVFSEQKKRKACIVLETIVYWWKARGQMKIKSAFNLWVVKLKWNVSIGSAGAFFKLSISQRYIPFIKYLSLTHLPFIQLLESSWGNVLIFILNK